MAEPQAKPRAATKVARPLAKSSARETIEAIVVALLLALVIRTFVVQAFKIPSGSMKPTLEIGDHILVNKFSYGVKMPYLRNTLIPFGQPQRGDMAEGAGSGSSSSQAPVPSS